MAKIVVHISNANGRLSKFVPQINLAASMAENYALSKLGAKFNVDMTVSDAFVTGDIIPESYIGGHTYSKDFITSTIDSECESIRTEDVFLNICHELCHAVRWQYNDEWVHVLLDGLFFEGVATAFEVEAANDNNMSLDYFTKVASNLSDEKNKSILLTLQKQLNSREYDYPGIFFVGDKKLNLPRWAGYSLGYYLVKKYLDKNNKKASDIFAMKYSDFADFVKTVLSEMSKKAKN